MYLDELQIELQDHTGVVVIVATICRNLYRLGLTRKKLRYVVVCRSQDSHTDFREEVANVNTDMIVDELGSDCCDVSHHYGYHFREMKLEGYTLLIGGKRLSVVTPLSTRDIEITEGTVNDEFCVHFVEPIY